MLADGDPLRIILANAKSSPVPTSKNLQRLCHAGLVIPAHLAIYIECYTLPSS